MANSVSGWEMYCYDVIVCSHLLPVCLGSGSWCMCANVSAKCSLSHSVQVNVVNLLQHRGKRTWTAKHLEIWFQVQWESFEGPVCRGKFRRESHFDIDATMAQTDPHQLTTLAKLSAVKRILEKDVIAMDEAAVWVWFSLFPPGTNWTGIRSFKHCLWKLTGTKTTSPSSSSFTMVSCMLLIFWQYSIFLILILLCSWIWWLLETWLRCKNCSIGNNIDVYSQGTGTSVLFYFCNVRLQYGKYIYPVW